MFLTCGIRTRISYNHVSPTGTYEYALGDKSFCYIFYNIRGIITTLKSKKFQPTCLVKYSRECLNIFSSNLNTFRNKKTYSSTIIIFRTFCLSIFATRLGIVFSQTRKINLNNNYDASDCFYAPQTYTTLENRYNNNKFSRS